MLDILRDLAISQSLNVWLCPAPSFACTEGCVILRSLVLCASSVAGYFDISNFRFCRDAAEGGRGCAEHEGGADPGPGLDGQRLDVRVWRAQDPGAVSAESAVG